MLPILAAVAFGVCGYAAAGLAGWVPWRTGIESTVASGLWLALAGSVLLFGMARIRAERYATSRRSAHRFAVSAPVLLDDVAGEVVDVSVNGIAAQFPVGTVLPSGLATVELPGSASLKMEEVRSGVNVADSGQISLRVATGDWQSLASLALWLFHTPPGATRDLSDGVPIVARTSTA